MYHCNVIVHIVSPNARLEGILRQVPPPAQFSCAFSTFSAATPQALAGCGVLILDLPDGEALPVLPLVPGDVQLILCAGPQELAALPPQADAGVQYADFWQRPIPAALPSLCFKRLLETMKTRRDYRFTQTCLDTAIDSIPDLVWFKDVRGSHEKVNEAFCQAVGKTKQQVQGRGHYYIWDLSPEDYASGEYVCLETEEEVIRRKCTCLFDEQVLSKHGLRQFKTYKSPIFDDDDTVIGTVGIAHDVTDLGNISTELEIFLGSIPFAVLIEDDTGHIIKVNKQVLENFQLSQKQIEGRLYAEWREELLRGRVQEALPDDERDHITILLAPGNSKTFKVYEATIFDIFHDPVGRLHILQDVTVEHALRAQILHNSNTDFLTGVCNRRRFYQYIRDQRGTQPVSLIYLDLDFFKRVNDLHGHQVGDKALVLTARMMEESFPDALITRLGGDEFLITLLGRCELATLQQRTQAMLNTMRVAFSRDEKLSMLSASAGIAQTEDAKMSIDALIQLGDRALYAAKESGRARCCVAE